MTWYQILLSFLFAADSFWVAPTVFRTDTVRGPLAVVCWAALATATAVSFAGYR